jgi:hypothetical protein
MIALNASGLHFVTNLDDYHAIVLLGLNAVKNIRVEEMNRLITPAALLYPIYTSVSHLRTCRTCESRSGDAVPTVTLHTDDHVVCR